MATVDTKTKTTTAPSSTGAPAATDVLTDPLATQGGGSGERTEAGTALGKQSWESALGNTIGGNLYKAVAPYLTEDKILPLVNPAWNDAVAKLVALFAEHAEGVPDDIVAKATEGLQGGLKDAAGKLMSDTGLVAKVGKWVDGNPWPVFLAAAAGAIGYLASNQPIPALNQKVKAGGFEAGIQTKKAGAIDLVKKFGDHIEGFTAGYSFKGGSVSAEFKQDAEKGTATYGAKASAALKGKVKDPDGNEKEIDRLAAKAEGKVNTDKEGLKDWSASGSVNANLGKDGTTAIGATYTGSGNRDGESKHAGSLSYKDKQGTTVDASGSYATKEGETSADGKLAVGGKKGTFTAGGTYKATDGAGGTTTAITGNAGWKGKDGKVVQGSGSYSEGPGGTAAAGELILANKDESLTAKGSRTVVPGAGGETTTDAGSLAYKSKTINADVQGSRSEGPGGTTTMIGGNLGYKGDNLTANVGGSQTTDPNGTTTVLKGDAAYKKGAFSANGNVNHTNGPDGSTTTAGGNLAYNTDRLKFEAGGNYASTGAYDVNGALTYKPNDNFFLKGGGGAGRVDNGSGVFDNKSYLNVEAGYRKGNFEAFGGMQYNNVGGQSNTQGNVGLRWRF